MQNNTPAFEEAKKFIESKNRFILASHARTDGDDGGSMLAMSFILQSLNKAAIPVAKGGVPLTLQFLPKQNEIFDDVPNEAIKEFYDGIILFGCNNKQRTGLDKVINSNLPVLNIDHHQDNARFGDINLVDETKSSVAELVFDFIKFLGVEITPDISKCLLTGIFTDTGSFMHSNTQASTLEAAGELMKYGARVDKIHEFTYQNKDIRGLKAWGKALENTRLAKNNEIAISVITEEDLREIGDLPSDTFGGFVETLNKIPGTRFAMFLRQDGNKIKGSIRSEENKKMDVSFLAKLLGGGGHKLAAGFELEGRLKRTADGGWKIEK
ncbi:MAG: phosphoesterase RecJ protein phosphoesterase RecJ protein [Candidatus Doudnabacteria bacterium]|nr:phosphoesterase RecJ protein phosphoesterase RecJ protein [Candidatus Doudnabacteria bacterium]